MRQLIEGKLTETREVNNVQVVVAEATVQEVGLSLMDDEGVFAETPIITRLAKEGSRADVLHQELSDVCGQNGALEEELTAIYAELEDQRRKCKKMWQMNCRQASAQE